MTDENYTNKKDKAGNSNTGAAAIGVAIGAASAAGVVMAMKHPKVRKAVIALKDKAIEKARPLKESIQKMNVSKEGAKLTKTKAIK